MKQRKSFWIPFFGFLVFCYVVWKEKRGKEIAPSWVLKWMGYQIVSMIIMGIAVIALLLS